MAQLVVCLMSGVRELEDQEKVNIACAEGAMFPLVGPGAGYELHMAPLIVLGAGEYVCLVHV